MKTLTERLSQIESKNAFELSALADCVSPDSRESEGAAMLLNVQSELLDALVYELEAHEETQTAEDLREAFDCGELSDLVHTVADNAPSIYTSTKWSEFADLGAFQEDPSELCDSDTDMDQRASVCLYMIAERCASALLESWITELEASDSEENAGEGE